jgi:hypothetical protein
MREDDARGDIILYCIISYILYLYADEAEAVRGDDPDEGEPDPDNKIYKI